MKFEIFTLEGPRLRRVTAMKSKNGTNDHFFRVFPSNKKKCCISNLIFIYQSSLNIYLASYKSFLIARPKIEDVVSTILLRNLVTCLKLETVSSFFFCFIQTRQRMCTLTLLHCPGRCLDAIDYVNGSKNERILRTLVML